MKRFTPHLHSNVPVFILAGGLGTRLSEETHLKPKPMVEIAHTPILIHIMRSYYAEGFNNFVICAGYKAASIKQYFLNYRYLQHNLDFDNRTTPFDNCEVIGESEGMERWRVRVLDTGENTMTGARIARAFDIISAKESFEHFAVTYGDGLTDASFTDEFAFHRRHGKLGTVLGVKNPARYGEIEVGATSEVTGFFEKSETRQGFVSGGFFFFKKEFRSLLNTCEDLILEIQPMQSLVEKRQLQIYKHHGFWKCMDTVRDKNQLEELCASGKCPWAKDVESTSSSQSVERVVAL